MVLSDNGKTSRYTYNAAGERIMKSYGTMEQIVLVHSLGWHGEKELVNLFMGVSLSYRMVEDMGMLHLLLGWMHEVISFF